MRHSSISPQAEILLQEIIDLKNNKLNTDSYWNNRFDSMNFDDEVVFRSLFKELKENDLIIVKWASDIPYILNLTNKGKNYFVNKAMYAKEKNYMTFDFLDIESEKLLEELIEKNEIPCTCFSSAANTLLDHNYVNGSVVLDTPDRQIYYISNIEHKGKTYFEMKERYEKEMEQQRPIIINTRDSSPVNMNLGNGNATQTINYASDAQIKALQEFVATVSHSNELTEDQKKEVLELIEEITEKQKSGKNTIVKHLLSCVTAIVSVGQKLKEAWDNIALMFK